MSASCNTVDNEVATPRFEDILHVATFSAEITNENGTMNGRVNGWMGWDEMGVERDVRKEREREAGGYSRAEYMFTEPVATGEKANER